MGGKQGDKHSKPGDSEEEVEEPCQELEGVWRPAPPVGPGAQRQVPPGPSLTHWDRTVGFTHVHTGGDTFWREGERERQGEREQSISTLVIVALFTYHITLLLATLLLTLTYGMIHVNYAYFGGSN